MLVCDNDGQFVAVNDAFATLLGYARNELSAGRVGVVTHPLDLAEHRERLEMLRSGAPRA